jgi:hypothetical protein
LRADGTVAVWGGNNTGQTNIPAGLSGVVEIAAGNSFHLALRGNGTVAAWGSGMSAAFTNALAGLTNVVAIEADSSGATFLRTNGVAIRYTTGGASNSYSLTNVVALAPFDDGFGALRADGTVFAAGGGSSSIPANSNVVAIAMQHYFGVFLKRDGTVQSWGNPLPPTNLTGIVNVASSAALRNDGTVTVWAGVDAKVPDNPPNLRNVAAVDTGYYHELALLAVRDFPAVLLPAALDTTAVVVSSRNSPQWFGQTTITHDGVSAAQSTAIGNNTASSMRMWVAGPITVSFWWKVSSETNHDFLNFSAGGVVLTNISGEVDWQQCTVSVPPGNQILQWNYAKDNAGSAGQDAGWVDQLQLIPQPPVILSQPAAQQVVGGTNVTFTVSATGTPTLSYRWRKDGSTVLVTGSPSYTLSNVTRTNSGTYSVVVTNIAGNVTSSNAVLKVHVPQHLGAPVLQPDGSMLLTSGDADGGMLSAADLANLQAQVSTNLVDWIPLPGALTLTNGLLQLQDPGSASYHTRFYRVLENW